MIQVVAQYPGMVSFIEADHIYCKWEGINGTLFDISLGIVSVASLFGSLVGKVKKGAARVGTVVPLTCLVLRRKASTQSTQDGSWEAASELNRHLKETDYGTWNSDFLQELQDVEDEDVHALKELIPPNQPENLPTDPLNYLKAWSEPRGESVQLHHQLIARLRAWTTVFVRAHEKSDVLKQQSASLRLYYGLQLLKNPKISTTWREFSSDAVRSLGQLGSSPSPLNSGRWHPPALH